MFPSQEGESEILLGNKQLVLIFLAMAVLLGVAFTGGFMVGRGNGKRTGVPGAVETTSAGAVSTPDRTPDTARAEVGHTDAVAARGAGQTHTVGVTSEGSVSHKGGGFEDRSEGQDQERVAPLGSRRPAASSQGSSGSTSGAGAAQQAVKAEDEFVPNPGTKYLQVAAVNRDEAEAVADVLHRKGFRAHAVPKPGSDKIFRVIIGPVRDAGDLSSTRDSLRKTGFREVIVQNY